MRNDLKSSPSRIMLASLSSSSSTFHHASSPTIRSNTMDTMEISNVQNDGIPSLPRSILTEFGQRLKDSINSVLVPIQEESSSQDELRDIVFREVMS